MKKTIESTWCKGLVPADLRIKDGKSVYLNQSTWAKTQTVSCSNFFAIQKDWALANILQKEGAVFFHLYKSLANGELIIYMIK